MVLGKDLVIGKICLDIQAGAVVIALVGLALPCIVQGLLVFSVHIPILVIHPLVKTDGGLRSKPVPYVHLEHRIGKQPLVPAYILPQFDICHRVEVGASEAGTVNIVFKCVVRVHERNGRIQHKSLVDRTGRVAPVPFGLPEFTVGTYLHDTVKKVEIRIQASRIIGPVVPYNYTFLVRCRKRGIDLSGLGTARNAYMMLVGKRKVIQQCIIPVSIIAVVTAKTVLHKF